MIGSRKGFTGSVTQACSGTLLIGNSRPGVFGGRDVDRTCQYSGNFNIIDLEFNVYEMVMTVESCSLWDGEYTGLAVLLDLDVLDADFGIGGNAIIFQVDNGEYMFTDILTEVFLTVD